MSDTPVRPSNAEQQAKANIRIYIGHAIDEVIFARHEVTVNLSDDDLRRRLSAVIAELKELRQEVQS